MFLNGTLKLECISSEKLSSLRSCLQNAFHSNFLKNFFQRIKMKQRKYVYKKIEETVCIYQAQGPNQLNWMEIWMIDCHESEKFMKLRD